MIISPSILAADFLNLENDIKRLNQTDCDWLHLDVMDGKFVSEITFGYPLIKSIKENTNKVLDAHLMVEYPQELALRLIELKIDIVAIHVEVLENVDFELLLKKSKENNVKLGLVINPDSSVNKYTKYLEQVQYVLLMSVYPGKGGQSFIEDVLNKVDDLRSLENGQDMIINIDGGINDKTISKVKEKKIDVVVSGSYLFSGDIQEKIDLLR